MEDSVVVGFWVLVKIVDSDVLAIPLVGFGVLDIIVDSDVFAIPVVDDEN